MSVSVPRIVAAVTTTATASLFTMVFTLAAMGAQNLRWDGSFCTTKTCTGTALAATNAAARSVAPAIVR